MNAKLLFIINNLNFFLSHRLPVALAAKQNGYEVHIAAPLGDSLRDGKDKIIKEGFCFHPVRIYRSSTNPLKEIISFCDLYKLQKNLKPDIVHLVTIKPVLYGGISARLAKTKGVVAAVPGLGSAFRKNGFKGWILNKIVSLLYKAALRNKNTIVIFQNNDDKKIITELCKLAEEQTRLIPGSGVNLKEYDFLPEPEGVPVITMASRLLKDKGVPEFIEAAGILKSKGIAAEFWLVGDIDPDNPTSVKESELVEWKKEGTVKILGFRSDVAALFSKSNIVVFPSSYREGLPKVLVEAASCGRAVITTDSPGCRDAIIPNKTGLLVPVKNASATADAAEYLIKNPEVRKTFGKAGRAFAEQTFNIEDIVNQHLNIYYKIYSC